MELLGSKLRVVPGRISSCQAWHCSMQDGLRAYPNLNYRKRNPTHGAQTSAIHTNIDRGRATRWLSM